jgi:dUTP pyrophosphatase
MTTLQLMNIEIKKFDQRAIVPKFAHTTDAAMDLFTRDDAELLPGVVTKIHTGIGVDIPEGYAGIIKDKSSVASRGLLTLGGVVDAGYQGEIIAVMINLTSEVIKFEAGQKVSQMLFVRVEHPDFTEVDEFSKSTARGEGGFGSTGAK